MTKRKKTTRVNPPFGAMQALVTSSLLLAFQRAMLAPVIGEYLVEMFGDASKAGLVEGLANIALLLVNLFGVRLILRIGKVKLFLMLVLTIAVADIGMALLNVPLLFIITYSLFLATLEFAWFCLNLIVKRYTPADSLHTTEGKIFVSANVAWLTAPILAGVIATYLGIKMLFICTGLAATAIFVTFYKQRKHFPPSHPSNIKPSIHLWHDIKEFVSHNTFPSHYMILILLRMYYAVMGIYLPIYLYEHGYAYEQIGLGLSISMLPFVLLEYPVGKLADRIGNEKYFFALGFILISLALSTVAWSSSLTIVIAIYCLGSTGAALIEGLNTSMFLKQARHHKTAMLGIYNTAGVIGWISGMLFASAILLSMSFNILFLAFVPLTLLGIYIAIRLPAVMLTPHRN